MAVEATSTLSVHMPGTPGYREATARLQPLRACATRRGRDRTLGQLGRRRDHAGTIPRPRCRGDQHRSCTVHGGPDERGTAGANRAERARRGRPAGTSRAIPAGTRWGAVAEAAAQYGLGAVHGSSPDVGAVGYLLKGGLSFYGRFGLAANSLRAVELVAADGQLHRVDADHDPSLFWAIRGWRWRLRSRHCRRDRAVRRCPASGQAPTGGWSAMPGQ